MLVCGKACAFWKRRDDLDDLWASDLVGGKDGVGQGGSIVNDRSRSDVRNLLPHVDLGLAQRF